MSLLKPEGICRDDPDKQGDTRLQPAYENDQELVFCLEVFLGKFCLDILFRHLVWKSRLEIL